MSRIPTMSQLKEYDFTAGRAVVIGAVGGIGEALAHGLAARGSRLVLLDIDGPRLEAVAEAITAARPGLEVATYTVDLADPAAVDRFAADVTSRYDDVTLLINDAWVALGGTFEQVSLDDSEWLFAVFRAVVRLTKAFLPMLRANPGSHLVNVSSVLPLIAPTGQNACAASTFAVPGFTGALRHDLRDVGVTTVHPGGILTGIAASARMAAGDTPEQTDAERKIWERLLTIAPETAAEEILEGVRRRRPRVSIGSGVVVPDVLALVLPRTYHQVLDRGLSLARRSGEASRSASAKVITGVPIPNDPGTRRTEVNGVSVRYRETGSPDAPPVVLIHGITRSLADWSPQHHLLGDAFRVISLDLPGYGRSEPMDAPHTLVNLSAFVEDFLDRLGIDEPVHLVGNSLGGAIALQVAVRSPQQVCELALFNSLGFGKEMTRALRVIGIKPLTPYLLTPSWGASARTERALFFDKSLATPARIRYNYALSHRPWAQRVLIETGRDIASVRGIRPQWRDELMTRAADLGIPLLVAWGEDDLILPARHLHAVERHFPQAKTHLFHACGHMPHLERPAEATNLLLGFWASHPSYPPRRFPSVPRPPTS